MPSDPYRVLGLRRGASVVEIKQAYRRLAKAHHPDTAGDGATARFLEIQQAYEMLVGPADRGRRTKGSAAPSEAWRADPERARATRDAWRARARRTRPADDAGAGRTTGTGPSGTGPSGTGPTGPGSTAPGRGSRPGRRGPAGDQAAGGHRTRRRATLGSTSYDEAEHEPFDPDWSGASWYGTTSGTYWTLNPKEYADPRKHGPEYQARARRRAGAPEPGVTSAGPGPELDEVDPATGDGPADDGGPEAERPAADAQAEADRVRTDARARAEPPEGDATLGSPPRARSDAQADAIRNRYRRPRFASPPGDVPPPRRPAPEAGGAPVLLRLLDDAGRSVSGRLVLALVGWVPIGIVLATAVGEGTGCARYLAECQAPFGAVTVIGHGTVVLLLALLPRLAAVATLGTVAMLAAAVPAAAVLSAFGGARDPEGAIPVFVVVLAAAWAIGIVFGLSRRGRATRPPPVP